MSPLLCRAREAARSNVADAIITMTATGSLSAAVATLAGSHLLELAIRKATAIPRRHLRDGM